MAKLSLGPQPQRRIERLLSELMALAAEGSTNPLPNIAIRLSGTTSPKLIVKTELRFLVELIFPNFHKTSPDGDRPNQSRLKDQLRSDLRLLEALNLLEDHRTKTQGSSQWHFTLKLWSTDPAQNLAAFRREWQRHKAQRNGQRSPVELAPDPDLPTPTHRHTWDSAPDLPNFHGRSQELATLSQWIVEDQCRLVAILGMAGCGKTQLSVKLGKGGIGKTDLSVKLAQGVQQHFDSLIWRSLHNAPTFSETITDLVRFLSNQQEVNLPAEPDAQIASLLRHLQQRRCLIILDNLESILEAESGDYRLGYEPYGVLFKRIAEIPHQSCLLLTSREVPPQLSRLTGRRKPVRFFHLNGLNEVATREIFSDIGDFSGTAEDWRSLTALYNGNPLALELTAQHIAHVYGGSITQFLKDESLLFTDLRELLDWHWQRLSGEETELLYWLAINREPVSIADLRKDLVSPIAKGRVAETMRSLQRRLPIEQSEGGFTLQPVLMEYVTERLIQQVCQEISAGSVDVLNRYALYKATAKDYIRESQGRVILQPLTERLIDKLGDRATLKTQLDSVLTARRGSEKSGYAAGNVINLLNHLQIDLSGYNFSNLVIWQAYLHQAKLQGTDFSQSSFADAVFTKPYGYVISVAFSPDGQLLAAGDSSGQVHLWDIFNERPLHTLAAHKSWVCDVDFSPNGRYLASGGFDSRVKIWEVATGQCTDTLFGDNLGNWSLAFSSDEDNTLAIATIDGDVEIWDLATRAHLTSLTEHQNALYSIVFHPYRPVIATSSEDKTIKLWDAKTHQCLNTLTGHQSGVRGVAFSPCGQYLVSGSVDKTVRLWDAETGRLLNTLTGHSGEVYCVDYSACGRYLASGSDDKTIRLWDAKTGQCLNTLLNRCQVVLRVAFSPNGAMLASASEIQGIRLWNVETGHCLKTLAGSLHAVRGVAFVALKSSADETTQTHLLSSGNSSIRRWDIDTGRYQDGYRHSNMVETIAVSPNQQLLAASSFDHSISLCDTHTLQPIKTLAGHTDTPWSVAFGSNSDRLISGSFDKTIKIWDLQSGDCLNTLSGHKAGVWGVAFHPSGSLVASCSLDQTIRLWHPDHRECLAVLAGHAAGVRAISLSADGKLLASGSLDGTVKIWDIASRACIRTLTGHSNFVWTVTFSPDSKLIASGGFDRTVRLWNTSTGQHTAMLRGHDNSIHSVAFSSDGKLLASSGDDETIWLWDVMGGRPLKSLKPAAAYENMDITGASGLALVQIDSLKALGAVSH